MAMLCGSCANSHLKDLRLGKGVCGAGRATPIGKAFQVEGVRVAPNQLKDPNCREGVRERTPQYPHPTQHMCLSSRPQLCHSFHPDSCDYIDTGAHCSRKHARANTSHTWALVCASRYDGCDTALHSKSNHGLADFGRVPTRAKLIGRWLSIRF